MRKFILPTLLLGLYGASCQAQQTATENPAEAPKKAVEAPDVAASRTLVWKNGNTWQKVHEGYVKRAGEGNVDLAFFGDSITQWWPWQDFKARYGPLKGANFGIGGDKTQHVLWRVRNGEMDGMAPKVAVVLVGTNNLGGDSPEGIAQGITNIVAAIREKSPQTKMLLVGVFPRGWNANEWKWYRPKIKKINALIAKLDDGENVRYADFGPQLMGEENTVSREVFKDGVHLSGEGYKRWASAMQPILEEMMGLPKTAATPDATGEAKPE